MKLSLYVLQGTAQGKTVAVTVPQFIIGRDPKCHLRPASPMISKRHCALLIREGKVYVRDFGSTNGTLVNDQRVESERELKDKDQLKFGPLSFEVRIETPTPVDKPTPLPQPKAPAATGAAGDDDQAIADMLLDVQEDEGLALGASEPDMGSTVLDLNAVTAAAEAAEAAEGKPPAPAAAPKKPSSAPPKKSETQSAAEAILAKMARRNRQ